VLALTTHSRAESTTQEEVADYRLT